MNRPIWYEHALKDLNQKEVPGPEANPRILQGLALTSLPADMKKTDETANCSGWMNLWMYECGMPYTGSAAARSWGRSKQFIKLDKPIQGCLVVLNRGSSMDINVDGPAHICLYDRSVGGGYIRCFGGNQADMCKFSNFREAQVIGYYWPKDTPIPQVA